MEKNNKQFSKLDFKNNLIIINKKKQFNPLGEISKKGINKAKTFAYNMTYDGEGEHRETRSGGSLRRNLNEIFLNTYRGKLAEIAFYEFFNDKKNINISEPDIKTYKKGKWDDLDFTLNNFKINVKSSTHFSNLLLLEKKDWNLEAEYIPNISNRNQNYDFFFFIRVHADNNTFPFDIPGYINNSDLKTIIKEQHLILKNNILGSKKVDADNYYVQAGDLRSINLKKLGC
jgi:hypothetical protein